MVRTVLTGLASALGCVEDAGLMGLGEPNNCANLTSFQMPADEFIKNVEAKVVMRPMVGSILG